MNYALLGGAGYVAPRHYRAIKDTGGKLVAIMDHSDSVGVIDSYFPEAKYFSSFERFDRYCSKRGDIDFVSICSPNYLHDAHCRFALRIGADAICEKPLVLRERNLDELLKVEEQTGKRVWNILQLRLSCIIEEIWNYFEERTVNYVCKQVKVNYCAPRGAWYDYSWKMNQDKSGGLVRNIGIHILDMIYCIFGDSFRVMDIVESKNHRTFCFSIQYSMGPVVSVNLSISGKEERTIEIDGTKFDLTPKIKELHTLSYENILNGKGFGIEDARSAIRLADKLMMD